MNEMQPDIEPEVAPDDLAGSEPIEASDVPSAPEPVDPALADQARAYGWKPLDEWKGDTSGWVPPEKFLDLPSTVRKQNAELAQRLHRVENVTRAAVEAERKRMADEHARQIEAIRAEQRRAVELGDVDAYEKAEKQREAIAPPQSPRQAPQADPYVADYMARPEGAWLANPAARAIAAGLIDQNPHARALPPASQVAFAEAEMRARYPHMVGETAKPAPPQRSRVDGGGLAAAPVAAKSWAAIPAADRQAARSMIGPSGVFKSEADYAAAYWSEN